MAGSFNDLTNQASKVTTLPLDEVKASPSVYSPNDGGYNSEENMRWATRKQVTKNFVIGDTVAEVNKSLNTNIYPDSISFGDGMFSIDGYTFKIAAGGNISYDKTLNPNVNNTTITTKYAQKFVEGLCGYGTDTTSDAQSNRKLESSMNVFCFSEFRYMNDIYDPYRSFEKKWLEATSRTKDLKDKVVGYVRLVYRGSFYDALNVSEYYVSFGEKNIKVISHDYLSVIEDIHGSVNVDHIKNMFTSNPSLANGIGYPFAILDSEIVGTEEVPFVKIYYPVFVKQTVKSSNDKREMVVYFEDILSLTFTHNQSFEEYCTLPSERFGTSLKSHTNFYPATGSKFVDMNQNLPLQQISENNNDEDIICKSITTPSHIFNYTLMYTRSSSAGAKPRRSTSVGDIAESPNNFDWFGEDLLKKFGLFEVKVTDDNVANQLKKKKETSSAKIGNTLSYFCLCVPTTSGTITKAEGNIGYDGNKTYVAFMTSDGRLCPDGFFCLDTDGNETTDNKIIEGYLHYFKRIYASSNNVTSIEDADLYAVTYWLNNNGHEYKENFYEKQLSYYLNLCYSSLLDNSWKSMDNASDIHYIKSSGCGQQLVGLTGISYNEFEATYNYTYDEFDGENTEQATGKIVYSMDDTSDRYKLTKSVINDGKFVENGYNCMTHTISTGSYICFDDPINFLEKCATDDLNVISKLHIKLYYINEETANTNLKEVPLNNIVVDEYLMPKCTENPDPNTYDFTKNLKLRGYFVTTDYSLINSLRYTFNMDTWYCNIPTTATIKKTTKNYLCGKITEDNKLVYGGIEFGNKLPCDVERNDLYLYNLNISTDNYAIDNSSKPFTYVSMSQPAYVQRNAFLHTSKIYGDDGQSFEEVVKNLILDLGLEDLEERVRRLEITIYGEDIDGGDPGLENIVRGNDDLEITGTEFDIDDLEDRVVAIEDELLNLLQDAGIIGPNAMYFIKKFGITNITGSGVTFDFGQASSNTSNYTLVSPIGNNELVRYICISNEITRLGDKLFYNCPNTYSVNAGQATKVNRFLVKDRTISVESGYGNIKFNGLPDDAYIYPRCTKIIMNLPENHKAIYYDDGNGNICKKTTKQICGTIDYVTGDIFISGYTGYDAHYTKVTYRYCTLAKSPSFQENKMPDSIVSIGDQVFAQNIDRGYKKSGLPSVNFGASLQYIGYAAFWGNALKEVNVPSTIIDETGVGTYAFAHCEDLLTATYKAKKLSDNVFSWCGKLNEFTLYNSCTKLGNKCFTYDKDLHTIKFIGTGTQWLEIEKGADWAGKMTNTVEFPTDQDISVSGIEEVICYPSETDAIEDTNKTDVFKYYPCKDIGNGTLPSPYNNNSNLHPTMLNRTPITTSGSNQTAYIKVNGTYTLIKTNDVDLQISYSHEYYETGEDYLVALDGTTVTTVSGNILSDDDYDGDIYYFTGNYVDPETHETFDANTVLSVNSQGTMTIKPGAQGKKAIVIAVLIIDGIVIRQGETLITVADE